ncbi:MAG: VIT1/CCC1 transporter family protein [Sulfitobacter sp.]|uniref:VIT1/CCC1 transporter family protein n=1 Tax=unclassified Sulfitobacter TaxID=196795 RepID=UPI002942DDB3|nr:VIT1/CCC1 transporter family protein [Sulfitobacter sp. LC.270.F.C4]WOI17230.1 VIT1/CCC1 transporter family protein [Sulfitobacter sp. LC.270.F.C4]
MEGEYRLSGVEPHPVKSAAATFLRFLAAGNMPLFPFILGLDNAYSVSAALTLVNFFAIGGLKSVRSLSPLWRSAGETLVIGGRWPPPLHFLSEPCSMRRRHLLRLWPFRSHLPTPLSLFAHKSNAWAGCLNPVEKCPTTYDAGHFGLIRRPFSQ